ncbi:MAG: 30S ribosome-binding factor RbfA [Bacteroidales bacterium]|nr:30S ribosome-binding factor RbfA [Bacteroidales bacterium]MDD4656138.1 30S ribosome-binding factor RbfA [Bacteroidales bacterium]
MESQSTRQLKVSRQLQRDLSEIFRERGTQAFSGAMITVTSVRISPDLSVARVYISIFPSAKTEEVLEIVENSARAIRGELGNRVSKQLRIVPQLTFLLDDSQDYVQKIDELLKK